MVRRDLLPSLLAVALAIGLAGCTGAPAGDGDERRPEGADGGDGSDAGPFADVAPGIRRVPLPIGTGGTVGGHVFDVTDGMPIGEAMVLMTCLRQTLPTTDDNGSASRLLDVAADGSFTLDDPLAFADCERIEYTIQAAGYTMKVPLDSGPIEPGTGYVVNGGMLPAT